MTRNFPDDNTAAYVGGPRARLNAHNLEVVKSGCDPSKGTGDWDVDYTSGTIIAGQSNGEVSVSSGTEDLADPTSDMSSGEERIVIVTINSSGNSNSVEGSAVSSDPATPDIPSGEVLIAFVHVQNSDSTLADSDLFDPRVLFGPSAYPFASADVSAELKTFDDGVSLTEDTQSGQETQNGSFVTVFNPTGTVRVVAGYLSLQNGDWNAVRWTLDDGSTQTLSANQNSKGNTEVPAGPAYCQSIAVRGSGTGETRDYEHAILYV